MPRFRRHSVVPLATPNYDQAYLTRPPFLVVSSLMPKRSSNISSSQSRRTLKFERLEGRECPAASPGLDLPTYLDSPPEEQPQMSLFSGEGEAAFAPLLLPIIDPASE